MGGSVDADGDARREIEKELARGERLLWTGRPRRGPRLRAEDAFLIPFSLCWAGFAVFWEYRALQQGRSSFMAVWGLLFVLIGAYIVVGRFFVDAYLRRQAAYGLTNERIIIISGPFSRDVRSLPVRTLPEVSLSERRDRSGNITFDASGGLAQGMFGRGRRRGVAGLPWPGRSMPPMFEMIDNARQVYEQIRSAQQTAA